MSKSERQSLTDALEELERIGPAVKRAADNYLRTVDHLLANRGNGQTPGEHPEVGG